ncbi:diphosphomevalonate decarboxylase [Peredibacter starrii]|uniref:diphosphomevalonate decarboxylase n=1 Tax=Peredibacter starrii TaxID=28202 RepID=A0AAX4HIQ8_9BACT|nr:diphosphomevalonate decarboxylase [Peredibacter starrii]WPU63145.1 diphosphomevalonate decarboxylase [Peredibacter starrii]
MSLISSLSHLEAKAYSTTWRSPSNIAFVKYWGKKGHQIPANPSLSMTLKECFTETKVDFKPADALGVDLFLEGKREDRFALKIKNYLETLTTELPWLNKLALNIETKNTFPHGAGIASSASGLSALALCLTDYIQSFSNENDQDLFFKRASFLSRLASGSACRSVYGGFTTWGEADLAEASDKYATPISVHPELAHLKDTVLVINDAEKSVSSRDGHTRMKEHAFAEARFAQAKHNFKGMVNAMKSGDMEEVGMILEQEALSLHAMFLTSPNAFTLFKPNSIAAMELIWDFRRETKLPLYFTFDAGPNLHLIYPDVFKNKIKTFISHELAPLAVKVIDDERGEGPVKC